MNSNQVDQPTKLGWSGGHEEMGVPIRILRGAEAPWGDYGDILMHGMTAHLGRAADGLLQLERTGPFVPPISFPGIGDIVVTHRFREKLEASKLTGLLFRPLHKVRIVKVDWDQWDRTNDLPPQLPKTGEPEDYILGRRHSATLANEIGSLWELAPYVAAEAARAQSGGPLVVRVSSPTPDIFRASGARHNYVSESAQTWCLDHATEYVAFQECVLA